MKSMKDILPTDDVMFKMILGNPKHSRILIHFLNSVVKSDSPITSVTIQNGEITKEFVNQKGSRLDIKAVTGSGELINIEMQCGTNVHMGARSLFYWAKMFSGQLFVGAKYEDLKRTISINVLDFNLFNDEQYWHKFHIADNETHTPLTELLEIQFIELNKINEIDEANPLTFWIEFLKHPYSKMSHEACKFIPEIEEANSVFESAKADPPTHELLLARSKALMDYANDLQVAADNAKEEGLVEGKELGREEGLEKGKIEMAKKMLKDGLPLEVIAKYTGLSISEIENLR